MGRFLPFFWGMGGLEVVFAWGYCYKTLEGVFVRLSYGSLSANALLGPSNEWPFMKLFVSGHLNL